MSIPPKVKRILRHVGYQARRGTLPLRRSGFSCFNEEQILQKYIDELLPVGHRRTAIDIGAGDGRTGSNTLALFKSGWRGVGVEGDARKAEKLERVYRNLDEVTVCHRRVTPENVLSLFEEHEVEKDFSVLNIDIDSYDYWVLDAILTRYRPGIVVTEINEKIPPPIKFRVNYDPDFELREHFFGYSIACLEDLCAEHDYALIDLEYNNAFLAPKELAGDRGLTVEVAYREGYLDRPDRREKFSRNENVEMLHEMSAADGMRFIRNFFAKFEGKYELSLDGLSANSCELVDRTFAIH